jgi:hypothetical protein
MKSSSAMALNCTQVDMDCFGTPGASMKCSNTVMSYHPMLWPIMHQPYYNLLQLCMDTVAFWWAHRVN